MSAPTVSCLMVTSGRRPALARRAIACFARQTYSPRELVVVCDGDTGQLGRLALDLVGVEHQLVFASRAPLGALRNLSLRAATGELVCQWDDDDAYHPDRLRLQVEELLLRGAGACLLTEHLHYFEQAGELAWIDWMRGRAPTYPHTFFPGSLLAWRHARGLAYPDTGPNASQGEDTAALLRLAAAGCRFSWIPGRGDLYVYTYHGHNTYSEEHHRGIFDRALNLAELDARRAAIAETMRLTGLPSAYTLIGPP